MKILVPLAAFCASLWCLAGCTTNATTGRSQFNALSREDEIALGTQAKAELIQQEGGEVPNPDLRAYIVEVGSKLAAVTEADNPSLPWEFTLLNSDVINAYALPGGKVFMSRGLAEKLTSEDQLAGVLGHEVGHVTARHINDKIARETGTSLGLGVVGLVLGDSGGGISDLGGQVALVALLSYDRNQELEADSLGMRYMDRVGYNPAAQGDVMRVLLEATGGGGGGNDFFATHPHPEARIERINELMASTYASSANRPQRTQEYRQRFLTKLALEPRPLHGRAFAFGEPATWCGICAEAAAAETQADSGL